MKQDHCLIPYKKMNSKLIKDLNVRSKSMKLLQENTDNKLLDISFIDTFF